MASSPLPPTAATLARPNSATFLSSSTCLSPFFANKFQKPTKQHSLTTGLRCQAAENGDVINNNDHLEQGQPKHDRRNMLIGLGAGSLYGVASLRNNPFALAMPITTPNFDQCDQSAGACCPPIGSISNFTFPAQNQPLRLRRAAQDVARDRAYMAKYKRAIAIMRALPDTDPRSLKQQAMVHCAYCNNGHKQIRFPRLDIRVHGNWLFFPFHRWYLYFFERIMGELIGDPTFALPFWNWDAPAGMYIPEIFDDPSSPLYDRNRDQSHRRKMLNLNYDGTGYEDSPEIINNNLRTMYQQMVYQANSHSLFFGAPYRAGEQAPNQPGNIELTPHGTIHLWTGDPNQQGGNDMGNFGSAGKDPLFYSHHCNVDRMWSIYRALGNTDIGDADWLNAEFLFYNEKSKIVRVKVRDSLDTRKLGYVYDNNVPIPWLVSKPSIRTRQQDVSCADDELTTTFPVTLMDTISVQVLRPCLSVRTPVEKMEQDEVLCIWDIEFDGDEPLMFDVFVNLNDEEDEDEDNDEDEGDDEEDDDDEDGSAFVGSFVHVPHSTNERLSVNMRLSLTTLLEELDAETDETLVVTLVPTLGQGLVSVGGFSIELIDNE